jgi:aspartate oxidase
MKKIIIIGSGISGLTLANKLKDYFEVLVLECKFFKINLKHKVQLEVEQKQ